MVFKILSACALLKTKGTGVVSQNDQLLQLIELFVKQCQYFVLLEQSNGFLIENRLCFDFWMESAFTNHLS